MNKRKIINDIINKLSNQLEEMSNAAAEAKHTATHEECVAENKYDTFGLEAAYLAEGLSRQVNEISESIAEYRQLAEALASQEETVCLGSVVCLEDIDGDVTHKLFIAKSGAGIRVITDIGEVYVVTLAAPLGKSLIGKKIDDEVLLTDGSVRYVSKIC